MKELTESAWARVFEKACYIVNASAMDDAVLVAVYKNQLMSILDELEQEFGAHTEFYDTRADFLEDTKERMRLYRIALEIAREGSKD